MTLRAPAATPLSTVISGIALEKSNGQTITCGSFLFTEHELLSASQRLYQDAQNGEPEAMSDLMAEHFEHDYDNYEEQI